MDYTVSVSFDDFDITTCLRSQVALFQVRTAVNERRRRELLGGLGGMPPQEILKSRGPEMLFSALSA